MAAVEDVITAVRLATWVEAMMDVMAVMVVILATVTSVAMGKQPRAPRGQAGEDDPRLEFGRHPQLSVEAPTERTQLRGVGASTVASWDGVAADVTMETGPMDLPGSVGTPYE